MLTNPFIYYNAGNVSIGTDQYAPYNLNVDGTFNVTSLSTLDTLSVSQSSTLNNSTLNGETDYIWFKPKCIM